MATTRTPRKRAPTPLRDGKPATNATARRRAEPQADEIAARAYEIYCRRNGAAGDPEADWLQAEAELRDERSREASAPASSSNGSDSRPA